MNPYLNRLPLTLDSWIICQDKEGWQLQGGELKISKLYGKWEGTEEVNKLNLMIEVPRLRGYLLSIGRLTKENYPVENS